MNDVVRDESCRLGDRLPLCLRDGGSARPAGLRRRWNRLSARPGRPRPAEGARPAPAERLYQVFKVDNGEVTEIRGYRDRASALARP
jgi:hypothetical protein